MIHDESLSDHPELVDGVVAAAGLALENERLQAQLRARLEDLRASRARVVETADVERGGSNATSTTARSSGSWRSRFARSRRADFADDKAIRAVFEQTRSELADTLAELRSRAWHPSRVLTERGLGPALDALAGRAHVPVDVRELPVSACRRASKRPPTTWWPRR